jgi:exonuclease VII large subunit
MENGARAYLLQEIARLTRANRRRRALGLGSLLFMILLVAILQVGSFIAFRMYLRYQRAEMEAVHQAQSHAEQAQILADEAIQAQMRYERARERLEQAAQKLETVKPKNPWGRDGTILPCHS